MITYTVFLFSLLKLSHLIQRHNPNVVSYNLEGDLTSEDRFDLSSDQFGFMIAAGFHGFYSGAKSDHTYIKWFARTMTSTNGVISSRIIPMHPCTDEDFAKFYPPKKSSEAVVKKYKAAGGLFCLDSLEGIELYGNW